jgi:putative FmdB family regulatory protein
LPIYEYECDSHGVFELELPMSAASRDAPCPRCGDPSRRQLSVPNVAQLSASRRKAHAINEQSRFEPRVVSRAAAAPSGERQLTSGHGRPWAIGH